MEIDPKIIAVTQKQFRRQHERGYHDKLLLVVKNVGFHRAQLETELGEIEVWQSNDVPEDALLIVGRDQWRSRYGRNAWTNISWITDLEGWLNVNSDEG